MVYVGVIIYLQTFFQFPCDIQLFMQWNHLDTQDSIHIRPAGSQAMAPIHHQHQSKTSATPTSRIIPSLGSVANNI